MRFIKIILLAVIILLVIALILQNQDMFTHSFSLGLNLQVLQIGPYLVKNILLIGGAFLAGVIFATMWGAFYALSMRSELKTLRRMKRDVERERKASVKEQKTGLVATASEPSRTENEAANDPGKESKDSPQTEDPFRSSSVS